MKLSLIVAMDRNGLIGKDGGLPWGRIPEDMRLFRRLTTDKDVVAGRKTVESLPRLDGRRLWMLSKDWEAVDWEVVFDACDSPAEMIYNLVASESGDAFVIGGAKTYEAFRPWITSAHVTLIDGEYEGDTYFPFPILGSPEWEELSSPRTLAPGVVYHHLGRVPRS